MKPTRGKVETTDHPPIYPTGEGDPSTLDGGQRKLYDLIARRFLATLMGPATIENTKLELDVNGEPFVASGDVLVTPGFREAYPYGLKRDEQMPPLEQGDTVDVFDIKLEAKQTEPPARYSQGKLVQEMEKRGLAPSPRARASSSACMPCAISKMIPLSRASWASPSSTRCRSLPRASRAPI